MKVVLCGSGGAFFVLDQVLGIFVFVWWCFFRCWVLRGVGLFPHLCATPFSGGVLAFYVFVIMFCFLSRQVLALVLLIVV